MCIAAPAKAHEVQFGLDQRVGVQSNLFGSLTIPTADGFYQISPQLMLAQPESDFTYHLEYQPSYRVYFNVDGINGWDQNLRARARKEVSARDAIVFDTEYIYAQAIRSVGTFDSTGQPLAVANGLGNNQRFVVNLGHEHKFSARKIGTIGFDYNRWDYTDSNQVDNQGFGGELQITQAFRERLVIGANVSGRYRSFEETDFAPASYSTVANMNLLLQYELTPTLKFDASGGPAGVFTRQGVPNSQWVSRWDGFQTGQACALGPCGRIFFNPAPPPVLACATSDGIPVLRNCSPSATAPSLAGNLEELILIPLDPNQTVFGQSSETLTYFIFVGLTQTFKRGSVNASFVRNEDAGSGLGTTTILNSFSGRILYELSDRWRIDLYGVYSLRTSVSQLPFTDVSATPAVDSIGAPINDGLGNQLAQAGLIIARTGISNLDQSISVAEMRLTRQLTERASLQFLFTYYNQFQQNQGGLGAGFDNYVGGISFVYEFDPYKL